MPIKTFHAGMKGYQVEKEKEKEKEQPKPADPPQPPAVPGKRRFVSNTYPNLSLGIGGKLYQFQNGVLETDNPLVIQAIFKHPWYKIHIHNG